MTMAFSTSDVAQQWIEQFAPGDQALACELLDALVLVSGDEFKNQVQEIILRWATNVNEPMGLYAEREGPPVPLFAEDVAVPRRASGPGPVPITSDDANVGSEGIIAQLISEPLETPRDRNGSYEPKIIGKSQTRFTGFDDKIISMYARGMSTREIQGHLEEIYKVEVSPTLISNVTEAVMEEVKSWQSRPLDSVYPIVYLDALVVKIRETGHVRNKAIYVVIGVNMQGNKEVLGLWVGQTEGAKFWLQVLTELKNRGVADMFIACVDGLKGFCPQTSEI
jgi:hypothetical protein